MSSISQQELELLIEQTYKVEREFSDLKASYEHLQGTIEEVVEFLPTAIWILQEDREIFLQNSKAKDLGNFYELLRVSEDDYELEFDSKYYLVKSSTYKEKLLFSATDITEQKKKENLATMGQMAAHLSHEIRNPIGSIALLSSTLKKRVMDKNIPIVEEIQKAIYKVERIIKATLMFSKGIKINKSNFLWSELQKELIIMAEHYGFSKEIEFIYPKDEIMLYADRDLLEMMFSNFLANAIDAIELDERDDGVIELSYKEDKEFHIFYIYDNGIEIERKDNLFEAFKSTKVKGNGLGLVLSKQIAEAHGGDVVLLDTKKKIFEIKIVK
ncbi:MAG: HAMP domain-containing sensor histidine kinase [Sulfurimonadaceae bacterium]|nr:HAMP domain-containing sensor histidine kinase [Sulfurimonadaceae bacterium]